MTHGFARPLFMAVLCLGLVAGTVAWVTGSRAADSLSEDAVKAAYLYRFAGYIDWPGDRPGGRPADEPFVIAVLDAPSVARELKRLLPGHLINERPVEVREVQGVRALDPEILFVGAGHADLLRSRAAEPASKSTLIVTDEEGGLDDGSVLNFLTVDRRVRFEVSLTAADRAHLRISSELLAVAVRVFGGRRQSRDGCVPQPVAGPLGDCTIREALHRAR